MTYAPRVAIWDAGDTTLLKLIPIDVAALQSRSPGDSIIYLYDYFRDPTQRNRHAGGFLLHNGGKLVRPLTIASNSRIVVSGDYNIDSAYAYKGDKRPYPAALISDMMVHLSNNFLPANHDAGQTGLTEMGLLPDARRYTALNACLMTGVHPNALKIRGALSLTRLMEWWYGYHQAINGSLVSMWYSQQTNGYENSPVTYWPPLRHYNFDTMYEDIVNMPPGTPRLVTPNLLSWEHVRK